MAEIMQADDGGVALILKGVTLRLRLNLNVTVALKERFGTSDVLKIMARFSTTNGNGEVDMGSYDWESVRGLLWCLASDVDDPLTERQIGRLCDLEDMYRVTRYILAAVTNQQPDDRVLAPFVPTPQAMLEPMLRAAADGRPLAGLRVVDLGCGDGRALQAAVDLGMLATGYELDAGRAKGVWIPGATIVMGDAMKADLSEADIVFLYLLTPSNEKLKAKLLAELPAGARIVSHAFGMRGWPLAYRESVVCQDGLSRDFFMWRIDEVRAALPTG